MDRPPVSSSKRSTDTKSPTPSKRVRTTVALRKGPYQWAKRPGNNIYGNRGTVKCSRCRKLKRRCEFNSPDEPCEYCRSRNALCGKKELAPQQRYSVISEHRKDEKETSAKLLPILNAEMDVSDIAINFPPPQYVGFENSNLDRFSNAVVQTLGSPVATRSPHPVLSRPFGQTDHSVYSYNNPIYVNPMVPESQSHYDVLSPWRKPEWQMVSPSSNTPAGNVNPMVPESQPHYDVLSPWRKPEWQMVNPSSNTSAGNVNPVVPESQSHYDVLSPWRVPEWPMVNPSRLDHPLHASLSFQTSNQIGLFPPPRQAPLPLSRTYGNGDGDSYEPFGLVRLPSLPPILDFRSSTPSRTDFFSPRREPDHNLSLHRTHGEEPKELNTTGSEKLADGMDIFSLSSDTANDEMSDSIDNESGTQIDQFCAGWIESFSTSNDTGSSTSELSVRFPFNPNEGLLKLLLEVAENIYHELDQLEDSGLALGLDILSGDMRLFDDADPPCFTGTRETLWLQYEATRKVDPLFVRSVVANIAHLISPFPVAAFDNGEFGIGLIVWDAVPSSSDSDISNKRTPEFVTHRDANADDSSTSNRLVGTHSTRWAYIGHSNLAVTGTSDGIQNSAASGNPLHITLNDQNHDNTDNVSGASQSDDSHTSGSQDNAAQDGSNAQNGETNGNDEDTNAINNSDGNDEEEDNRNNQDPPSPRPIKEQERKKNERFSGTVTLCVNDDLQQELTVLFGVHIRPSIGCGFADCEIVLDPVTVTASTLFPDDDDDMLDAAPSTHFYVTQHARITVGPSQGTCDVPIFMHPLRRHFVERWQTSTKNQVEASFEASAHPKFIIKGSRGSDKTTDYDPVTLALEPGYIGPAARNGYRWEYEPVGPVGTNLELSSRNPPVHEAVYRVYDDADTPESMRIAVQATFRQNGKLGRQKAPKISAARRILRDLNAMHIIARLEVKIANEDDDWFLFPAASKEGSRLQTTIKFNGGKLGAGIPQEVRAGDVVAKLNSKVSSG